jgi:LacI family transcriptional regulator
MDRTDDTPVVKIQTESGKSLTIALLIESSREFGRQLLHGITRYSRLHDHWRFYRKPGGLTLSLPHFKDWDFDGAIVRDSSDFKELISYGVPMIFVQHKHPLRDPFPTVLTNSEQIAAMAVEHFLDRGFCNFAFCGFNDFTWSKGRERFFVERLEREGYDVDVYHQKKVRAKDSRQELLNLGDWLKTLPKPIAVMACNDDRAVQVLEACRIANITVPEEMAVIGVDNDELTCELSEPTLSSIALNIQMAGYQAAEMLNRIILGKEKMQSQEIYACPTHIVTRQSSDILAISDAEVATALRFIKQSANKPIQVSDVVNSTSVSRRILEKRFRIALNRPINQEITRVRTEFIIKLALETDFSITRISRESGFDGVEHISRYFRRQMGMSLSQYRKQNLLK